MPYLAGYVTPQDYGAVGNGSTDDTVAINSALAAVSANGSTILFPSGYTYKITSTLVPTVNGTIIQGQGWGSQILYDGTVATTAIAPTGNIRCFLRDIRISQSNATHAGTTLDWSGCNTSVIEKVMIDGGGSGVSPSIGIKMNASTCHYNVVRDCRVGYGGTSSQGIVIEGTAHANTIDNTRFLAQSDDVNSSGVYITNAHSTTLIRPDVESAAGNGIWLDTGANSTMIYNAYCDTNNINLKISSGVIAPTVSGSTLQGGVTANIQDNGSISPSIVNAWPNSGSNSYSSVALTNVAGYSLNGVPVPGNVWQSSDHNLVAWAYDPALSVNGGTALSGSGVLHLIKVILRYPATINNVLYQINTAASGLTSGENFVGIYDSTGTRRAVSADLSATWTSTGFYTTAMTASYSAPAGTYYIAFVVNGTTGPSLARMNGLAGASSAINVGLTAANYRYATNGTGNTSLPASITLSSNAQDSIAWWAALS